MPFKHFFLNPFPFLQHRLLTITLVFFILLLSCSNSFSRSVENGSSSIAIIYPDNKVIYRSTFNEIIEGIEEKSKGLAYRYPFNTETNTVELIEKMKRNNTAVAIILGREGLETFKALEKTTPIIAGGIFSILESEHRTLSGISLTPDPELFFSRIKIILPKTRKVIVVYNGKHNEWLIKLAWNNAKAFGLTLLPIEAHDLSTAARSYAAALRDINPQEDALWILQDATTLDENTIFSMILKESWTHSIPVFSSNLAHVKKGLLFALYPNNTRMGNTLAKLALDVVSGNTPKPGLIPLKDINSALNLRIATHVGIEADPQAYFDLIFSEH